MERSSILAVAFLSGALALTAFAQSTTPPARVKTEAAAQMKQDKKISKEKAKSDRATANAQSGKKATTSQDAAYSLSYKLGTPK